MEMLIDIAVCSLDETLGYDMREEAEQLLSEWYGGDLSAFDPDDQELNMAFAGLMRTLLFSKKGAYAISSYEKLRMKYDALLEVHTKLIEEHRREEKLK